MSFILDAIRKADGKRPNSLPPQLRGGGQGGAPPPKKSLRPVLVICLVLILLFNAAVMIWLFGPWSEPSTAVETEGRVAIAEPAPAPAAGAATKPAEPIAAKPPATDSVPAESKPLVVVTQRKPAVPPPTATEASAATEPKVYAIRELPPRLRDRLPNLKVSLHAFNPDDPDSSLVRINGELLRVGSKLSDRFRLVEVTGEGAILETDGVRFLLSRRGYSH